MVEITKLYPDSYNQTIMMDTEVTSKKNEILRRIKFHKAKTGRGKDDLPAFVRKEREKLVNEKKFTQQYDSDGDPIYDSVEETMSATVESPSALAQKSKQKKQQNSIAVADFVDFTAVSLSKTAVKDTHKIRNPIKNMNKKTITELGKNVTATLHGKELDED